MRFAFIDAWKEVWPVEFLCGIMQVTSRGFRAWRNRPMSRRPRDDMVILAHVREQHRLSLRSYGRPRMTEELQELGLTVGQRRIGRLMRENDIKIIRTQKYKATTDSNHTFNIAPNLLDQDFYADGPNQKWAGDISYIWTSEGWLYLAVIIDLYSRRVIGWAVSNRMKRDLAIRALDMAVALRQSAKGCIHQTDRGSQYCPYSYQKRLSKYGFKTPMGGKGNVTTIPWSRRSSNPSRQSRYGETVGRRAAKLGQRYSGIPTGSIIRAGGIHRQVAKAPWHSSERPHKRVERPERKRDKTSF